MLIVIMHYANSLGLKKTLQKGGKNKSFFRRHRKKLLGLGAGAAALTGLAATGGLAGLPALGAAGVGAAKTATAALAAKAAEGIATARPVVQRVASDVMARAKPKLEEAARRTVEQTAQGLMGAKQMASEVTPAVQEMGQRFGEGVTDVQERVAPLVQDIGQRVGEGVGAIIAHPATQQGVEAAKKTGVKLLKQSFAGPNADAATQLLSAAVVAAVDALVDQKPKKRKREDEDQPAKKMRKETPVVEPQQMDDEEEEEISVNR